MDLTNMKTSHRFFLSLSASFGLGLFIRSSLSLITIDYAQVHSARNFWDSYLENYRQYTYLVPYLIGGAFIFFLLFVVLEIHKKKEEVQ